MVVGEVMDDSLFKEKAFLGG